jgi:hypothetical protein
MEDLILDLKIHEMRGSIAALPPYAVLSITNQNIFVES